MNAVLWLLVVEKHTLEESIGRQGVSLSTSPDLPPFSWLWCGSVSVKKMGNGVKDMLHACESGVTALTSLWEQPEVQRDRQLESCPKRNTKHSRHTHLQTHIYRSTVTCHSIYLHFMFIHLHKSSCLAAGSRRGTGTRSQSVGPCRHGSSRRYWSYTRSTLRHTHTHTDGGQMQATTEEAGALWSTEAKNRFRKDLFQLSSYALL